jgi:5'-nucleotidase
MRDLGRVARAVSYGGHVVRALITNDDGIDSPGLWALAAAARDAGLEVVVAAPHLDSSGVGTSVVSVRDGARTEVHARELPGLPGVEAWAVEGHPAYIVHVAGRGWLEPAPEVVLSGINVGANVGRAVLHSGTIGAVLTAARHGWRGLAVSLETAWPPPAQLHWDTAVAVLTPVLAGLLTAPAGTVVSLNVPDLPVSALRELREARLARFGIVQVCVSHQVGENGEGGLDMTVGELEDPPEPGTDAALLAAGHPTLTELTPLCERPGVLARLELGG